MAAYQCTAGFIQYLHRAFHHLENRVFHFGLKARGNGGHGGSRQRLSPHGKNITQGMVGRNTAEQIRVVDEGTKKIHGVHHGFAGGHLYHRCVVGRMQAYKDLRPVKGFNIGQCAG